MMSALRTRFELWQGLAVERGSTGSGIAARQRELGDIMRRQVECMLRPLPCGLS